MSKEKQVDGALIAEMLEQEVIKAVDNSRKAHQIHVTNHAKIVLRILEQMEIEERLKKSSLGKELL